MKASAGPWPGNGSRPVVRKGVTASHYDFSTLEGPVRKALQDWADHVCSITQQTTTTDNVSQLQTARTNYM